MRNEHPAWHLAASVPWAIREENLHQILEIAARENPSVEAVEARLGRKLDNAATVTNRDGVAILPVTGPIFRRANLFTELSGATSIEILARDFNAALEDPAVHSIVLDVDSPGGTVNGVNEFAEMIFAARGRKPITAFVGGMGASAAYWIASSADTIVLDDTAEVGSIGVVAVMRDPSKAPAKDIEIVSSQSPKKRLDPTTEAGRSEIQKQVDTLADIFLERVARNRGVTTDAVLEHFGQGGIQIGRHAVASGMADRVGSLEGVISDQNTARRPTSFRRFASNEPGTFAEETETQEMAEPKDEKSLKETLLAFLGIAPKAAEAPAPAVTADAADAAVDAAALRARVAELEDELKVARDAKHQERDDRVKAEVDAFMKANAMKFGQNGAEKFAALLTKAKAEGNEDLEKELLEIAAALVDVAPTDRAKVPAIDEAKAIEQVVGAGDQSEAAIALESLAKRGIDTRSANFNTEYLAELTKIRAAAVK